MTDPHAEAPPPRREVEVDHASFANTEVAIMAPPDVHQPVTQLQGTPFPDDLDAVPDPDGTEPTLDTPLTIAADPTRPLVKLPDSSPSRPEDAETPAGTASPLPEPDAVTRASRPGPARSGPPRPASPPVRVQASGLMKAVLAASFCLGAAGLTFFLWALYVTRGRTAPGVSDGPTRPAAAQQAIAAVPEPSTPALPVGPGGSVEPSAVDPSAADPNSNDPSAVDPSEVADASTDPEPSTDGLSDEPAPRAGEHVEVHPFELRLPRLSRQARRMDEATRRRQSNRLKAAAMRAYREQDYVRAEELYREAMQFNTWDVGSVEGLARSTARQARFDEAVAWAELAVSRAPRSPIAYRVLGDVWRQAGHADEARAAYQRGIHRAPDDRWLRQRMRALGDG